MILLRNLLRKGVFDGAVTLEILNALDGSTVKQVDVTIGASGYEDDKIELNWGSWVVDSISAKNNALVVSIFNDD